MSCFDDGISGAGDFDEYLWPLTDAVWPVNWTRITEEHRLRQRLQEILTHVEETHVAPRVRRLGVQASPAARDAIKQAVIAGPLDGPLWERTLRDPVPRVLREEWIGLCDELRALCLGPTGNNGGRSA